MHAITRNHDVRGLISSMLMGVLLLFGIAVAITDLAPISGSHVLPNSEAGQIIGASDAGCGLLVGVVGGMVALSFSTVTLGLGAALAISATLHAAAYLCYA